MPSLLNNVQIVLIEPSHPGNIGAVARSMMTMGLSRLCMVRPKKFPHVEATKRAAGAESILLSAKVVDNLESVVGDCTYVLGTSVRDREVTWPTFDPRESAQKVCEHILASRPDGSNANQLEGSNIEDTNGGASVAILFGRESSGMTNQEMDLCDSQIRIPANDEYSSLNLASAVQIIAYELRMKSLLEPVQSEGHTELSAADSLTPAQARQNPANKAQREGHIEHLQSTLESLDFIKTKPPTALMRKLTRLFNKAELTVEEIQILRGILSAIDTNLTAQKKG